MAGTSRQPVLDGNVEAVYQGTPQRVRAWLTRQVDVPTTMSGQDVLNGYMIVNVTVQLIHPAEFIELTFIQAMQGD